MTRTAGLGEVRRDMVGSGGALVILEVTGYARRAVQAVVVVDVAIGARAWWHRVHSGQRETGAGVVKRRVHPVSRVVTGIAGLREIRRHVVGIGSALIILEVAAHAGGAVQAVVVVDVAISAGPWRHGVHSGQREPGAVVVEGRIHPVRGVVTLIAGLREVGRHVVGIRRPLIVLEVASDASGAVQTVVIVDVAIGAGSRWHRVHSGERESGGGVVKRRVHPVSRVVTGIAGLREVGRHVVGIRRSLIVLEVAGDAGRAGQGVVIVDMAIGARARRHRV